MFPTPCIGLGPVLRLFKAVVAVAAVVVARRRPQEAQHLAVQQQVVQQQVVRQQVVLRRLADVAVVVQAKRPCGPLRSLPLVPS